MKKVTNDLKKSKMYCYLILLALGTLILLFMLCTTIINFSQLRAAMTFLIFINISTVLLEMLQFLEKINDDVANTIKFIQLVLFVIVGFIFFIL